MFIIGINAFHGDSSACLLKDGRLIAAAEEERFRRIKHWAGFPSEAIRWCLLDAGINLEDVHLAQAKNYLVAYNFPVGLLINFGGLKLEYKKVFNPRFQG